MKPQVLILEGNFLLAQVPSEDVQQELGSEPVAAKRTRAPTLGGRVPGQDLIQLGGTAGFAGFQAASLYVTPNNSRGSIASITTDTAPPSSLA